MGPATDPLAVVDDRLRRHGLDGLLVVDALMIADKASDFIRGRTAPEAATV